MFFCYLNQLQSQQVANPQIYLPYQYFYTHQVPLMKVEMFENNPGVFTEQKQQREQTEKELEKSQQEVQQVIEERIQALRAQRKQKQKKNFQKCQDYIPYNSRKKSQKNVLQNAKRNIIPNLVHQVFCFIQKKKKSGALVQNYLRKENLLGKDNISVNRFYGYQKLIKEKTNNYMNEKALRQLNKFQEPQFVIYSREEQEIYLKIDRILVRYFFKNQIQTVILTSVRMKQQTRLWHMELKRKLLQNIQELFCDI